MTKNEKLAKKNFLNKESYLSNYATLSSDSIREIDEDDSDIRPAYFHDIDRVIHSLSYTRYLDKTQVFTKVSNDHVSKRITHVQLVSKIARTIGRALNLNEDLIEAIALAHDIGHTPLGHSGEAILNEISLRELGEYFAHNIQGVRHLHYVEKDGNGLNLSIQVLDGVMCHNGEILSSTYTPIKKDINEFFREYIESYKDLEKSNKNHPMTLEGCVVRISDIIGYIGRDIEDAIMIGKIKRDEIPKDIVDVLGCTNKEIVNTIIMDIINNSIDKPYIKMSDGVFKALFDLKKFNYKYIYSKSLSKKELEYYKVGMNKIFDRYLNDILNNNTDSIIFKLFLNNQSDKYLKSTCDKRKVIDFIAGMTDEMFIREVKNT